MKSDLSIIVPIYNVESYLEKAIEALTSQIEYNYEIILVNDGSTDSCFDICKKYQKNDRIKVINKENEGLVSARKAGLVNSEGRYITFLDGDDWIDKNYYFNMVKMAKESDADVVCSGYTEYENDRCKVRKNSIDSGKYEGKGLEIICKSVIFQKPYYTFGIVPTVWSKIFKREYLMKYMMDIPNAITIGEDGACTFPLLFHCKKIAIMNENVGYYYRKSSGSMMNSYSWERVGEILNATKYIDKVIKTDDKTYEIQKLMYFSTFLKYAVKGEAMSSGKMEEKIRRLDYLCRDEIMYRTLRNMEGIAVHYRLMFQMLKRGKYRLVIYYYKFYNKLLEILK